VLSVVNYFSATLKVSLLLDGVFNVGKIIHSS
ncbi:MAG: hypothetical protein ACI9DG_001919, partial [Oleispira sp.]